MASRFDEHFKMSEQDAIEYARDKLTMFGKDAVLKCEEIGDGNINYVFRIEEPASRRSVIIKHADVATRSSGRALDMDRNRIEAEVLRIEWDLAPNMVPKVYSYDPLMRCFSMEDLSDHENMRYALCDHKTFPLFADHITDFLANTLVLTSDVVMDPHERRELSKRFVNPLCWITESLVYTDPYTDDSGNNRVFGPNKDYAEKVLYKDMRLRLEVAKLKNAFLSNNQALIHGDVHTGSIFVRQDSTKVLDPEFAFFGPMGYDVGNVIGNLFFAWANGFVTIDDPEERQGFLGWVEKTVTDVTDLFSEKFRKLFCDNVKDIMFRADGFLEWYLSNILADTAGVAGLEMHRRTVGSAKVKDLISIEDSKKRAIAERIVIACGKRFILDRCKYMAGAEYVETVKEISREIVREYDAEHFGNS